MHTKAWKWKLRKNYGFKSYGMMIIYCNIFGDWVTPWDLLQRLIFIAPFKENVHWTLRSTHIPWLGSSISSCRHSMMRACFISAEEIVRKINLILEEVTSEAKSDYSEWKEQSRGRKGSKTSNWHNWCSTLNCHKINHKLDDFCSW